MGTHLEFEWNMLRTNGKMDWCNLITHLNNLGSALLRTTINDKLLHTFGIIQQNCNKHKTKKKIQNFKM